MAANIPTPHLGNAPQSNQGYPIWDDWGNRYLAESDTGDGYGMVVRVRRWPQPASPSNSLFPATFPRPPLFLFSRFNAYHVGDMAKGGNPAPHTADAAILRASKRRRRMLLKRNTRPSYLWNFLKRL